MEDEGDLAPPEKEECACASSVNQPGLKVMKTQDARSDSVKAEILSKAGNRVKI